MMRALLGLSGSSARGEHQTRTGTDDPNDPNDLNGPNGPRVTRDARQVA